MAIINYIRVYKYAKRTYPNMNMYHIFQQREELETQRRAFEIGVRAAQGYNIYLTFGSNKTIAKSAEDSYNRYAMAMKHYGQVLCDKNRFIAGYIQAKES